MIKVQIVGTKNKVDFVMYLSRTIVSQNKRVLVVDSTVRNEYLYALADHNSNEMIFELQGVEIMKCGKSWLEVESVLKNEGESINHYDCVIVDMDNIHSVSKEWGKFNYSFYVSDCNRFNLNRDIKLLHELADRNDELILDRVHFDEGFSIPSGYLDLLMNNRINYKGEPYEIEYDDRLNSLFLEMQHEQYIPLKKLDKAYKALLIDLTVEWFGMQGSDVKKGINKGLFNKFKFKSKKESLV